MKLNILKASLLAMVFTLGVNAGQAIDGDGHFGKSRPKVNIGKPVQSFFDANHSRFDCDDEVKNVCPPCREPKREKPYCGDDFDRLSHKDKEKIERLKCDILNGNEFQKTVSQEELFRYLNDKNSERKIFAGETVAAIFLAKDPKKAAPCGTSQSLDAHDLILKYEMNTDSVNLVKFLERLKKSSDIIINVGSNPDVSYKGTYLGEILEKLAKAGLRMNLKGEGEILCSFDSCTYDDDKTIDECKDDKGLKDKFKRHVPKGNELAIDIMINAFKCEQQNEKIYDIFSVIYNYATGCQQSKIKQMFYKFNR